MYRVIFQRYWSWRMATAADQPHHFSKCCAGLEVGALPLTGPIVVASALLPSILSQETQGHPKRVLGHSALGGWSTVKGDVRAPGQPQAWQL